MSRRAAAWIAWSIAGFVATLPVLALGVAIPAERRIGGDLLALEIGSLFVLACVVVGALVVSREPSNAVGWLLSVIGGIMAVAGIMSLLFELDPGRGAGGAPQVAAWFANSAWIVFVPLVIFVPLLFPDGSPLSRGWRWVAWLGVAATAVYGAGVALEPGALADYTEIDNPIAIGDTAAWALERGGFVLVSAAFAGAVASVGFRYRRSGDEVRQQIKCLAAAAVFIAVCVVAGVILTLLGLRALGIVTTLVGFASLPVAIGVAMLRYRLYDVDRLVSRSITYAVVTAALVLTYAGLVLAGQAVLRSFAGGSDLAIAVSTLVVAALFLPLRVRVQRVVDRRFYRRRYDARQTVDAFGARLREQVELDALSDDLERVVADTMQPVRVSLWLREGVAR